MSSLNEEKYAWWNTTQEFTFPRPLSLCQAKLRDQHTGQNGAGGYQTLPQSLQRGSGSSRRLSPSQYGWFKDEIAGSGFLYSAMVTSDRSGNRRRRWPTERPGRWRLAAAHTRRATAGRSLLGGSSP